MGMPMATVSRTSTIARACKAATLPAVPGRRLRCRAPKASRRTTCPCCRHSTSRPACACSRMTAYSASAAATDCASGAVRTERKPVMVSPSNMGVALARTQ